MLTGYADHIGARRMHRRRSPMPLAGLAAVCILALPLGAAPAAAQQSTIPDVCPGGEMRGPEGECVPGTGMGRNAGMTDQGMTGQETMGPGMMGHERMMGRRGHAMKVMFAIADADGDGALSFEEVTVIHKRIFDSVDTDNDGKVTVDEIQAFLGR
jgi:hypothetical protein